MTLRCKEGDLALVIHDEPGCRSNIGRTVEVRGPVEINPRLGLHCWLIRPAGSNRSWRVENSGWILTQTVSWGSQIEHPDAWLLPIPPSAEREADENTEPEAREAELVLAGAPGTESGGVQS